MIPYITSCRLPDASEPDGSGSLAAGAGDLLKAASGAFDSGDHSAKGGAVSRRNGWNAGGAAGSGTGSAQQDGSGSAGGSQLSSGSAGGSQLGSGSLSGGGIQLDTSDPRQGMAAGLAGELQADRQAGASGYRGAGAADSAVDAESNADDVIKNGIQQGLIRRGDSSGGGAATGGAAVLSSGFSGGGGGGGDSASFDDGADFPEEADFADSHLADAGAGAGGGGTVAQRGGGVQQRGSSPSGRGNGSGSGGKSDAAGGAAGGVADNGSGFDPLQLNAAGAGVPARGSVAGRLGGDNAAAAADAELEAVSEAAGGAFDQQGGDTAADAQSHDSRAGSAEKPLLQRGGSSSSGAAASGDAGSSGAGGAFGNNFGGAIGGSAIGSGGRGDGDALEAGNGAGGVAAGSASRARSDSGKRGGKAGAAGSGRAGGMDMDSAAGLGGDSFAVQGVCACAALLPCTANVLQGLLRARKETRRTLLCHAYRSAHLHADSCCRYQSAVNLWAQQAGAYTSTPPAGV